MPEIRIDFGKPAATLAHIQGRPAFLLKRCQQILTYLYVEECQRLETDLTQPQLEALCVVSACPGVDQTTLAHCLGIDRASATAVIDALARRLLLKRVAHSDRRRWSLQLTAAARPALRAALSAAKRSEQKLLQRLSASDARRLLKVLGEIARQNRSPAPVWEPPDTCKPLETLYGTAAFLLDRCGQLGAAYLSQAVTPFGLSPGQYAVLFVIGAMGPLDQSGLRRALGIDRSSVSVIVPVLQERNFIAREMDLLDRRRAILRCTQAGIDLLQNMHPSSEAAADRIFDGLAPDVQARLCILLTSLLGAHDGLHPEYSRGAVQP